MCNVVQQWSKKYPFGFLDPLDGDNLIKEVLEFAETILAEDHVAIAKQIRRNILKLVFLVNITFIEGDKKC